MTTADLSKDELEAALGGDREGMRQVCEALYPTVQYSVAAVLRYRRPGSRLAQDRDDLVQEVFRYLLDNDARPLRLWDPERAGGRSLRSWVGLIAGRHAGRILARRQARVAGEIGDAESVEPAEPSVLADTVVQRDLLDKLLDRLGDDLNEDEVALFEAIFVEVRPATEVAKDLGIPANTVHKRCQRLRQKITTIASDLTREGDIPLATLAIVLLQHFG